MITQADSPLCPKPNRLSRSMSRYLRMHQCDPIDWLPWGEEAFEKAREEDKPIFLSIGYSSCHWCHVMHRESFQDPEVASILNSYYVPVKVDREEMPDVDEIYMAAAIAITGSGGWPLTVFLTPDLRAFYAGTYFPRERLLEILSIVKDLWGRDREKIYRAAEEIYRAIEEYLSKPPAITAHSFERVFEKAYTELASYFDPVFGGFGSSSKFPMIPHLGFLLRYWYRSGDETTLRMAVRTANSMIRLGLHDHIGGGFFRYTVDRGWRIPHFEKMLYDNAQIIEYLVDLYRATGAIDYLVTARKTADFLFENMLGAEGLFYSSLDSEAGGVEGETYLWSEEELLEALGRDLAEIAKEIYGWSQNTLIDGKMHPIRAMTPMDLARRLKIQYDEALKIYSEIEEKLYIYRISKKPKPEPDRKYLADWNSLAIKGLAKLYLVSLHDRYIDTARKITDTIWSRMWLGDRVAHIYYGGESSRWGYLRDTALYGDACIDLYMATQDEKYLERALEISASIERTFIAGDAFIENPGAPGARSTQISVFIDDAIPSGASAALNLYARLYQFTGDRVYRERAYGIYRKASKYIESSPQQHIALITSMDQLERPSYQVAIASRDREEQGLREFLKNLWRRYWVGVVAISGENPSSRVLADLFRGKVWGDKPVYYICYGTACALPTQSYEEALRRMDELRSQGAGARLSMQ